MSRLHMAFKVRGDMGWHEKALLRRGRGANEELRVGGGRI